MGKKTKTSTKRRTIKKSNNGGLNHFVSTHESIGFIVREVWRSFARSLQPRIAREGVSIGMWFVLRMLWDEDGMTQRELGERVGINGPTMVAALNSMERAGLVRRVQNEDDLRKINVYLTERGRRLKTKLWPMAAEILELALSKLTRRQIQALRTMLLHIARNLERDQLG